MALVVCPECGREKVSDSALACPSCGFNVREYFEKIQFQETDSSVNTVASTVENVNKPQLELVAEYAIKGCPKCGTKYTSNIEYCVKCNRKLVGYHSEAEFNRGITTAKRQAVQKHGQLIKRLEEERKNSYQKKISTLTCPKCGSTAITTGARGYGGFWLHLGANKTVNRCGNCGNMWKPGG